MKINRIVIVDDDYEYINEIEVVLMHNGFTVIKKNNSNHILNFIKTNKPDLVILDLKINGMTGIDISRLLRKDKKTKLLPIIYLTNYYPDHDNDFKKKMIQYGITICLNKIISPEQFITEIKKLETN